MDLAYMCVGVCVHTREEERLNGTFWCTPIVMLLGQGSSTERCFHGEAVEEAHSPHDNPGGGRLASLDAELAALEGELSFRLKSSKTITQMSYVPREDNSTTRTILPCQPTICPRSHGIMRSFRKWDGLHLGVWQPYMKTLYFRLWPWRSTYTAICNTTAHICKHTYKLASTLEFSSRHA